LPFCCLRNFTFFGINMTKTLKTSGQLSVISGQFSGPRSCHSPLQAALPLTHRQKTDH
jgi:hypothetical protein